ncbi:7325_t:CDS:1, partial [Racocetra fulgida]
PSSQIQTTSTSTEDLNQPPDTNEDEFDHPINLFTAECSV